MTDSPSRSTIPYTPASDDDTLTPNLGDIIAPLLVGKSWSADSENAVTPEPGAHSQTPVEMQLVQVEESIEIPGEAVYASSDDLAKQERSVSDKLNERAEKSISGNLILEPPTLNITSSDPFREMSCSEQTEEEVEGKQVEGGHDYGPGSFESEVIVPATEVQPLQSYPNHMYDEWKKMEGGFGDMKFDLWKSAPFSGLMYKFDDFKKMCEHRSQFLKKEVDQDTGIPESGEQCEMIFKGKDADGDYLPKHPLMSKAWKSVSEMIARRKNFKHPTTKQIVQWKDAIA